MDITPFIKAKSDQLNADDLLGGPITVQIERVTQGNREQPVVIHISGGHMPWKPSKTALRVLAHAWGTKTGPWEGRWLTLYRDETVKWAGEEVGGIRIKAMSHITEAISLSLAESKGKKKNQRVAVLKAPAQKGAPTANLDELLVDAELTRDDVDRWRAANGKPLLSDMDAATIAKLAGWLAGDASRLNAIRALIPDDAAPLESGADGEE